MQVDNTGYLRRLEGDSAGEPIVLVTDARVIPAVHWAFRVRKD